MVWKKKSEITENDVVADPNMEMADVEAQIASKQAELDMIRQQAEQAKKAPVKPVQQAQEVESRQPEPKQQLNLQEILDVLEGNLVRALNIVKNLR
jgi:predicted  nucleic acid-binding Zn-ribbon protein